MTFTQIKARALQILAESRARYLKGLRKSLAAFDSAILAKGKGFGLGHVSVHKDGTKWRKVAPHKWRQVFDESRGAKGLKAFKILQKRIAACDEKDAAQMSELVQQSLRFCKKIGDDGAAAEFSELSHELQAMVSAKSRGEKDEKSDGEKVWQLKKHDLRQTDGIFGKDYTEFRRKGTKAVEFIKNNGAGCVTGAFYCKGLGDIDVAFGKVTDPKKHTGFGIAHIIDKHPDFDLSKIDDILKNGKVEKRNGQDGVNVVYGDYLVGLNKNFRQGKEKIETNHWIVTAYEKKKAETPTTAIAGHFTNGANESANRNDTLPDNQKNVKQNLKNSPRIVGEYDIDGLKIPRYDVSEIEKAKNWDELEKAAKPFGWTFDNSLYKADFEVVREALTGLAFSHSYHTQPEFSVLKDDLERVLKDEGEYDEDALFGEKNKTVFFRDGVADKEFFESAIFESVLDLHYCANTTIPALFVHETAHKLCEFLRSKWDASGYKRDDELFLCNKICMVAIKEFDIKNLRLPSNYASDNAMETVAECFLDVYANGNDSNEFSKGVFKMTMKLFKEAKNNEKFTL